MANRQAPAVPPKDGPNGSLDTSIQAPVSSGVDSLSCPRCTFQNHPSLTICEICGGPLASTPDRRLEIAQEIGRNESPGPIRPESVQDKPVESIKISFRTGGDKIFYERLKNALVQRKWLLQSAPPIPKPRPASGNFDDAYSTNTDAASLDNERNKVVGIAGLERRNEIIALAEQFSSQANLGANGSSDVNALATESVSALGLVTTKDMLGSGSESLYISELSRNLAEWLTDDKKGILRKEGDIMTLVDLWAVFNRARGGVELISPSDFEKAARMWDKLKLPVRLRQFKSGLLVVQGRDRTDEKTIASLLAWLKEMHNEAPSTEVAWDWKLYGRGITAQETAERFGWSVGVATEELEMAEEMGALCREQGLDGIRFWENWLVTSPNGNVV
jgi:ESCRT-II complex subunit VPS36